MIKTQWLFVPVLMLMAVACKSPASGSSKAVQSTDTAALAAQVQGSNQSNIEVFLARFELAILSHDARRIMPFMDIGYRTEQHDSLLKKNTPQFLNIFFGGYNADGRYISQTDFTKITQIKRQSFEYSNGYYNVNYTFTAGNTTLNSSWVVFMKMRGQLMVYGLYGPVGIPESK